MYPLIRIEKRHPDGSPRAAWHGYRLADHEGAVRVWTPSRTPRIHVNGRWTPDAPLLTAWSPGERFVAHRYEDPDGPTVYVDIVRAVEVTPERFVYVDLYADVIFKFDRAWAKDEDLLVRLAEDEALGVTVVLDGLLAAAGRRAWPFDLRSPRYDVPELARALAAGPEAPLSP